jgi:hypothetical protein
MGFNPLPLVVLDDPQGMSTAEGKQSTVAE